MKEEEQVKYWNKVFTIDYTDNMDKKTIDSIEHTRRYMQEQIYNAMAISGPPINPERIRVLEARIKVLEDENAHYRSILGD